MILLNKIFLILGIIILCFLILAISLVWYESLPTPNNMFNAIIKHENNKIEKYIEDGFDVNQKIIGNDTPIFIAFSENNNKAVILFLKKGININAKGGILNSTLLLDAATAGDIDMLKLFYEYGAKINTHNDNKDTPLTSAAYFGHKDVLLFLLDHGADVDIEVYNKQGQNALFCAIYNKRYKCVEVLLKYGANIESLVYNNATALLWAIYKEDLQMVKLLLSYGANVNNPGKTRDLDPPLMVAAIDGNVGIVEELLKVKNININQKNTNGYTTLDKLKNRLNDYINRTQKEKYLKIIEILKSHGAKNSEELDKKLQ